MEEEVIKKIISVLAIITLFAGLFGMFFTLPFLWSAHMEDLVGAGFPFVGGAILFASGLLTLGIMYRK